MNARVALVVVPFVVLATVLRWALVGLLRHRAPRAAHAADRWLPWLPLLAVLVMAFALHPVLGVLGVLGTAWMLTRWQAIGSPLRPRR